MIARHGSYRVVADETGISLDSVRTYVRRVYKKLGINSRSQLRARLIHEGLYADT
jgi:DNA-binding CsgD family transcriptional regulator